MELKKRKLKNLKLNRYDATCLLMIIFAVIVSKEIGAINTHSFLLLIIGGIAHINGIIKKIQHNKNIKE